MIDPMLVTIDQWHTYINTGLWTFQDGNLISPEDITLGQLKDHLLASGGAVYLREDGRFGWFNVSFEEEPNETQT